MSDAFEEIQAIKIKRNSLREKLQKRKRERHELFTLTSTNSSSSTPSSDPSNAGMYLLTTRLFHLMFWQLINTYKCVYNLFKESTSSSKPDCREYERDVLGILHQSVANLPITSADLTDQLRKNLSADVSHADINKILENLAGQDVIKWVFQSILDLAIFTFINIVSFIRVKEVTENGVLGYTVLSLAEEQASHQPLTDSQEAGGSVESPSEANNEATEGVPEKQAKIEKKSTEDIMSLILMPTIREKESKKVGEQILDLLSKQTSKEKSLAERFRSQGGAQVMEFCPHGTRFDCAKLNGGSAFAEKCKKLHFKKIIQSHTDESLGDCSFLNTCFHMDTCKWGLFSGSF